MLKLPHLYYEDTTIVRRPENTFHYDLVNALGDHVTDFDRYKSITGLSTPETDWNDVPNQAKVKIRPLQQIPFRNATLNFYTSGNLDLTSRIGSAQDDYEASLIPVTWNRNDSDSIRDTDVGNAVQHAFLGVPLNIIPTGQDFRLSISARYRHLLPSRSYVKPVVGLIGSGPTGRFVRVSTNRNVIQDVTTSRTANAFLPTHYKAADSFWFPHIHQIPFQTRLLLSNNRYEDYEISGGTNLLFLSGSDTSYWFCLGFEMQYFTGSIPTAWNNSSYISNISMTMEIDDLLYVPKFTKPFGQP